MIGGVSKFDQQLLSQCGSAHNCLSKPDRLVGLVVMASSFRAADPGFDLCLRLGCFSGSSHTSDFKTGTQVAALPGTRLESALGLVGLVSVHCDLVR